MNISSYEEYKQSWLEEIKAENNNSITKGRLFAVKLITEWLDNNNLEDNMIYCDGANDGGIDVAFLDDSNQETDEKQGSTWYVVQSKYGSAFAGKETILSEGIKIIDTLSGKNQKLNIAAEEIIQKIQNFKSSSSDDDKIILLFATEDNFSDEENEMLAHLRLIGREKIGSLFDVKSISIQNIYENLSDNKYSSQYFDMNAKMELSGENLLVGSVTLLNLYDFLKKFQTQTGDLDKIYEKNVRKFLGGRGKVNKGMKNTLENNPELFGLFNNGMTVVVQDFKLKSENQLSICDPFIVNGCQTTKTIWSVCDIKLNNGATGKNSALNNWKEKASKGVVVIKIVKVGTNGDELLRDITRYTNSQNAVKDKDFIALDNKFKEWQKQMSDEFNLYLEIQRGGWDSQKAWQSKNVHSEKRYEKYTVASDLLKIYGAGWLEKPGMAYGKNSPFLPDGSIFKSIMDFAEKNEFGVEDLYAAYLLQLAAEPYKFGRSAEKNARKQSRYLFYYVVLNLLKSLLINLEKHPENHQDLSLALIKILQDETATSFLLENAIQVIDDYLTKGEEGDDTAFNENEMEGFNYDLNSFLKSEKLGAAGFSARLHEQLKTTKKLMKLKSKSEIEKIKNLLDVAS